MLSKTLECPSLSDFVVVKDKTVLFMIFPNVRNRWICFHREYDPEREHSFSGKKFLTAHWVVFDKDCYWKKQSNNGPAVMWVWCFFRRSIDEA